jgi:ribosome-binding protein aMBF1 (putative translation factor)
MGAMNGGTLTHETLVMPANREREAFEYATRLCERLPRALQECRECAHLSRYALQKGCGVSRDMLGDVEHGDSVPTLFVMARIAHGMGMTLTEFIEKWEAEVPSEMSD